MLGHETLSARINGLVQQIAAIIFDVVTGKADLVRAWASYGGNVNSAYRRMPPALACHPLDAASHRLLISASQFAMFCILRRGPEIHPGLREH